MTVSHNRAQPHWYRHWQYYRRVHCHFGTGSDSLIQQNTATFVKALTLLQNRTLPPCYRHWQYHTTEHCQIVTYTNTITQKHHPLFSSYTTLAPLSLKALTQNFWSAVSMFQTLRLNQYSDQSYVCCSLTSNIAVPLHHSVSWLHHNDSCCSLWQFYNYSSTVHHNIYLHFMICLCTKFFIPAKYK